MSFWVFLIYKDDANKLPSPVQKESTRDCEDRSTSKA
jgi:hypothetical protein